MKIRALLFNIIPVALLFGVNVDQVDNFQLNRPISSFCSTSEPKKLRIFTNFQFVDIHTLYNDGGKEINDGEKNKNYDGFGNLVSTNEYNLKYSSNILLLYFDYMGAKNTGYEIFVPIYFLRTLNNRNVDLIGLGDFKFGAYFIWEQYFAINKMKTSIYYQYSRTGYTISNFGHLKSVGKFGFGLNHSIDLFMSKKSFVSFKADIFFSNGKYYNLSDSTESYTPNRITDIVVRYKNDLFGFLSYSIDYGFYKYDLSKNTNRNGYFSSLTPGIGFNLLNNQNYGYLNISHIDLVFSYSFSIKGKNYVKPYIYGLSINTYFE